MTNDRADPQGDAGVLPELRHWFFQKLNPQQRMDFLFAAKIAPRTCDFTLEMQHKAIRIIAARLSTSEPSEEARRKVRSISEWTKVLSDKEIDELFAALAATTTPQPSEAWRTVARAANKFDEWSAKLRTSGGLDQVADLMAEDAAAFRAAMHSAASEGEK